jgi:hypothetical protein
MEMWVAWNLSTLSPSEATTLKALMPWILRVGLAWSKELIEYLEIDPEGRWIRAVAHRRQPSEALEAHVISALGQVPSQVQLERAIKAGNDYARADSLHPSRAIKNEPLPSPLTPDELREIYKKCVVTDNLAILILGTE